MSSVQHPTMLATEDTQEELVVRDDLGQLFDSDSRATTDLQFETDHVAYTCIYCEETYLERSRLSEHVAIEHPDKLECFNQLKLYDIRIIKCNICNYSTIKKHLLVKHMRIHTGIKPDHKPYVCNVCNKTFTTSNILNRHGKIHTDHKPHVCNVCNKSFRDSGTLKLHMRLHTGYKPYTCMVCNKAFIHKENLNVHLRTHTGNKPHVCNICNKAFTTNGNLKVHAKIHSGYKPFICKICNLSFAQEGNLKTHTKRKHAGYEIKERNDILEISNNNDAAENVCMSDDLSRHILHSCKICNEMFDNNTKLEYHMLIAHTDSKSFPEKSS